MKNLKRKFLRAGIGASIGAGAASISTSMAQGAGMVPFRVLTGPAATNPINYAYAGAVVGGAYLGLKGIPKIQKYMANRKIKRNKLNNVQLNRRRLMSVYRRSKHYP